jgi:hypothetical protein
LEITQEGSQIVKASKIQMLVTQFEEIRMGEEETFDEFYSKLSTIRNSTINLGKKMIDAKIIKKMGKYVLAPSTTTLLRFSSLKYQKLLNGPLNYQTVTF